MDVEEHIYKTGVGLIEWGYKLRDYRNQKVGLRWSWAVWYKHGITEPIEATDYGYSRTKFGARWAAQFAMLKCARKVAKQREQ